MTRPYQFASPQSMITMRLGQLALIALCFLLGAAHAGPIAAGDESKCSSKVECSTASKQYLNYEPGKTYEYDYYFETTLPSENSEDTNVVFTADVELVVHDRCEMAIQFRNVKIDGPSANDQKKFQQALEAEPLAFSYDNKGQISTVCPSVSQPQWATNVARGFLSMLQTDTSVHKGKVEREETDVMGKCKTRYWISKNGMSHLIVKKEKDMSTCTKRYGADFAAFPATISSTVNPHNNLPFIVQSTFVCEQDLKNNIFDSISCHEEHNVPFKEQYKISTVAKINLKRVLDRITVQKGQITVRSNLLFDHNWKNEKTQTKEDVEGILRDLCPLIKRAVRQEAPQQFTQLVHAIKQLSVTDLESIYQGTKNNAYCYTTSMRDVFLDGVSSSDSGEAYAFLGSLLMKKDEVKSMEANMWYLLMSSAKNSSENAIEAFLPILKTSTSRHALLGITSMISRYCYKNSGKCEYVKAVHQAIEILSKRLVSNKECSFVSKEQETLNLVILKALGNVGNGHITEEAAAKVTQCFASKTAPESIRIAAVGALRNIPCYSSSQKEALDILNRDSESTVIRIIAFMHLMRCPSSQRIEEIKDIYNHIHSDQVATFMYTYLTNLQTTNDPLKHDVKNIVANQRFEKRFPSSATTHSKNYELSRYIKGINMGFAKDLDVIFPDEGIFPRYTVSNFTLGALGNFHNIQEQSYYIKGLEGLIEKMLTDSKVFDKLYQLIPKEGRDLIPKEMYNSFVKAITEKFIGFSEEEPDFIAGLRIYGSDITQITLEDIKDILQAFSDTSIMELFQVIAGPPEGKEFTRGLMFLDTKLTAPTISGMPITLDVNGTALLGLKVKGKTDMSDLSNGNAVVDFRIEPSFASEVSVQLAVDTYCSKPGKKLDYLVHAFTPVAIKFEMQKREAIKLALIMPRNKIEIINFRMDFYEVGHDGTERLQLPKTKRVQSCIDNISKTIGTKICFATEIPRPLFGNEKVNIIPINGPVAISVWVDKVDSAMEGYELSAKWTEKENERGKHLALVFNTPGSAVDRLAFLRLNVDELQGGKKVDVFVKTPKNLLWQNFNLQESGVVSPARKYERRWTDGENIQAEMDKVQASVERTRQAHFYKFTGLYQINENLLKANISLEGSGLSKHSGSITVRKDAADEQEQSVGHYQNGYTGDLQLSRDGKTLFEIGSHMQMSRSGKKSRFDFSVSSPNTRPFLVGRIAKQGGISLYTGKGDMKFSTDILMNFRYISANVSNVVSKVDKNMWMDTTLQYKIMQRPPQNITVNMNLARSGSRKFKRLSGTGEMRVSNCPSCSGNVTWDFFVKPRSLYKSELSFYFPNKKVYGRRAEPDRNMINIVSKVQGETAMNTQIKLDIPDANIKHEIIMDTDIQLRSSKPRIEVHLKSVNKDLAVLNVDLLHETLSRKPLQTSTTLEVKYPDRELKSEFVIQQTSIGVKGNAMVQWQKGQDMSLEYEYKKEMNEPSNLATRYECLLKMIGPLFSRKPLYHRTVVTIEKDSLDINSYLTKENVDLFGLRTKFSTKAPSHIELKIPSFECNAQMDLVAPKKLFQVNALQKSSTKSERRIKGFIAAHLEKQDQELIIDVAWDADKNPTQKIHMEWSALRRQNPHTITAKFHYCDKIGVDFDSSYEDDVVHGPHAVQLNIMKDSKHSAGITMFHEMRNGKLKTGLTAKESGKEKLKVEAIGKYKESENRWYLEASGRLTSSFKIAKDVKVAVTLSKDRKTNLVAYKGDAEVEIGSFGTYGFQTETAYPTGGNLNGDYKFNVEIRTPVPTFKSLQLMTRGDVSTNNINGKLVIARNSNTLLSIESKTEFSKNRYGSDLQIFSNTLPKSHKTLVHYLHDYDGKDKKWEIGLIIDDDEILDLDIGIDTVEGDGLMHFNSWATPKIAVQLQSVAPKTELENFKGWNVLVDVSNEQLLWANFVAAHGPSTFHYECSFEFRNEPLFHTKLLKTRTQSDQGEVEDFYFEIIGSKYQFDLKSKVHVENDGVLSGIQVCRQSKKHCLDLQLNYGTKLVLDVVVTQGAGLNVKMHSELNTESNPKRFIWEVIKQGEKRLSVLATLNETESGYIGDLQTTVLDRVSSWRLETGNSLDDPQSGDKRVFLQFTPSSKKNMSSELIYKPRPCAIDNCVIHMSIKSMHHDWEQPAILQLYVNRNVERTKQPLQAKARLDFPLKSMDSLIAMVIVDVSDSNPTGKKNVTYTARLYDLEQNVINSTLKFEDMATAKGIVKDLSWNFLDKRKNKQSGSMFFGYYKPLKTMEIWYRVHGHDVKVTGQWEVPAENQILFHINCTAAGETKRTTLVAKKEYPCSSLTFYGEKNRKYLEIDMCTDKKKIFSTNVTTLEFDEDEESSVLSQIILQEFPRGVITIDFRFPMDRFMDLIDLPAEVENILTQSHMNEVMAHMETLFQELYNPLHNGIMIPFKNAATQEWSEIYTDLSIVYNEILETVRRFERGMPDVAKIINKVMHSFELIKGAIMTKVWSPIKSLVTQQMQSIAKLVDNICGSDSSCSKLKKFFQNVLKGAVISRNIKDLSIVKEGYASFLFTKIETISESATEFWKKTLPEDIIASFIDSLQRNTKIIAELVLPEYVVTKMTEIQESTTNFVAEYGKMVMDAAQEVVNNIASSKVGQELLGVKDEIVAFISRKSNSIDTHRVKTVFVELLRSIIFPDASNSKVSYQLDYKPSKGQVSLVVKVPMGKSREVLEKMAYLAVDPEYRKSTLGSNVTTISTLWTAMQIF